MERVLVVAPTAGAYVLRGLQVHLGAGVEVVREVDEEGFEGLGTLGGAVLHLALVGDEEVGEPQGQLLLEAREHGYVPGDESLADDHVSE